MKSYLGQMLKIIGERHKDNLRNIRPMRGMPWPMCLKRVHTDMVLYYDELTDYGYTSRVAVIKEGEL